MRDMSEQDVRARLDELKNKHDEMVRMSGSFGEHVGTRLYRQASALADSLLTELGRLRPPVTEAERTGVSDHEHWEITDGGVGPPPRGGTS